MYKVILIAVLAIGFAQADKNVIKAFQSSKIVPQLIANAPPRGMTVEFLTETGAANATYGNKMTVADVEYVPYTQWLLSNDETIKYYSLMAVDLDAEKTASGTGYLIWLNANITGDYEGDLDFEYIGPTASNHRIVILVFYQKAFIEYDESLVRENFNVAQYAKTHGLTLWSGNFFITTTA